MLACNGRGIGNLKSTAEILASLARREAGLALGCAHTNKCIRREVKAPVRVSLAKNSQGCGGQSASLVETAARVLGTVQRNRDNQKFTRRLGGEFADGVGQKTAQSTGGGAQLLILEGVNHLAQASVINTEGYCAYEGRRSETADTAKIGLPGGREYRLVKSIAALGTRRPCLRRDFRPAGSTNWRGR